MRTTDTKGFKGENLKNILKILSLSVTVIFVSFKKKVVILLLKFKDY